MPTAFDAKTLSAATATAGKILTFAKPVSSLFILARSGEFWVRVRALADAKWDLTTPVPAANAVAEGWVHLGTGEGIDLGEEDASIPVERRVAFIDAWCVVTGDLVAAGRAEP